MSLLKSLVAVSVLLVASAPSANAAHVHAFKRAHAHGSKVQRAAHVAARVAVVAVKPRVAPAIVPLVAIAPPPVAPIAPVPSVAPAAPARCAAFGNCGVERDNVEGASSENEDGEYVQTIDFGR